jgi:hypothetical protein
MTTPPTLLTVGGVVSLVIAALSYVAKKVIDVGADVWKARILSTPPKRYKEIYGPNAEVIKRIEVDFQSRE